MYRHPTIIFHSNTLAVAMDRNHQTLTKKMVPNGEKRRWPSSRHMDPECAGDRFALGWFVDGRRAEEEAFNDFDDLRMPDSLFFDARILYSTCNHPLGHHDLSIFANKFNALPANMNPH